MQLMACARCLALPRAGNSMAASGSAVPRLAALYDFIMNTVEMFEPGAAAEVRAEIEKVMPEEQFRNDLLDNVGGSFWSFSLANQGVMQMPASVYSLEAKDPDAFIAALTKIVGFIGKENNIDVAVVKSEGEGPQIYELDLSKTPAAMTMMAPGFAAKDGELMISLESSDLLRQALDGTAGKGSLTEVAGFSEFVGGLKEKGDIVSVSFSDNAQVFESMYGQVTGMAQMFGGGLGGDIPVDLSLLPTEGSIKKHLKYSFSGQYKADEGRQVISEARSQFDIGDFMPFLVMGAMFATLGQTVDMSAMAEGEKDPAQQVNDDLGKIKAGLTIYRITNGGYPDGLDQLVEPHPDYPNGFLGSPELPADPWGNAYLFRMEGKKPVLWSAGPDGANDSGGGDDIVKGA